MVALIVVGAIVKAWGHYVSASLRAVTSQTTKYVQVPYMILGELICVAGTTLLTRLDLTTPTVAWAAYLIGAGIGMGIAMQLPYTAVQVTLP